MRGTTMKTLLTCLCCAAALVMIGNTASATTFMSDSFSYADGQLTDSEVGGNPGDNVSGGLWTGHSGETFEDNVDVIGGQAELLNSGSEDVNRSAHPAGTIFAGAGDKWYYAAMVTVNDTRSDPNTESINNDYFMHFIDTGFGFRGRSYLSDPNAASATTFTFGLSATSGGQTVAWGSDFAFGTQHKIVVSYDFDSGATEMWVDPVDINSTSIVDLNGAGAGTFVGALAMRQDYLGGTPNNQIMVDGVALGNDFDTVMMNAMNGSDIQIPEPTSLALVFAGLASLTAVRRSKRS